jgi:hypothetical protein
LSLRLTIPCEPRAFTGTGFFFCSRKALTQLYILNGEWAFLFLQNRRTAPITDWVSMPSYRASGGSLSHMNFSSPLLFAAWARLARRVSLTLLPALASESMVSVVHGATTARATSSRMQSGSSRSAPSVPYLTLLLPPPLRFQDAPPPIDTTAHLAAAAPPSPSGPLEELAVSNRDAAVTSTIAPGQSPSASEPVTSEGVQNEAVTPQAPRPSLVKILPDDTPRDVGAEDVLPYFQFPGTPPAAPTPSTLPPSSATYRQR